MYLEKFQLSGRKAVVTGGGRGIGLATAQALAEAGAEVAITDIDADLMGEAAESMSALGHVVRTAVLDVSDSEAVSRVCRDLAGDMNGVDILIANAGMAWRDTPSEDMPDDLWLKILDVNLNGSFWTCREFGRHMLGSGGGSIVTVGSMSGLISNKPQRQTQYNAAKAAVHHMTRSLAAEWAQQGIRVNSVAPTYVNTVMSSRGIANDALYPIWMDNTPMRRVAEAEEVAASILFLASDAASAITGAILPVDCGYTIW